MLHQSRPSHIDSSNVYLSRKRITQQTKHKLNINREKLRLAEKAGKIGVFEWDLRTGKALWTNEIKKLYGIKRSAEMADYQKWLGLIHPDDRNRVDKYFRRPLSIKRKINVEFRVIWPNNSIHWIQIKSNIIKNNGDAGKLVGIGIDITKQKKLEQNQSFLIEASSLLSSSLDYQKTLTSVAKLAVPKIADWCVVDMLIEGHIKRLIATHIDPKKVALANELTKKYPIKADDPTGVSNVFRTGISEIYETITDEMLDSTIADKQYLKIICSLGFRSVMLVPLIARGHTLGVITFVTTLESHRNYGKEDLHIAEELAKRAAMAVDNAMLFSQAQHEINERKEAEKQALHLASIVENSEDAIITTGLRSEILSWNKGAERIYGFSKNEAIGKSLKLISPRDKREEFEEIIEVIRLGEGVDHLETVRCCKDGRRIDISITISPIHDDTGKIVGTSSIARDISVAKELERRKDAFIGMASHELNTPITGLKAFNQVLQSRYRTLNDKQKKYLLNKMEAQIDRLANLVSELLDLSKIQMGKLELDKSEFNLINLTHEMVGEIRVINDSHQIRLSLNNLRKLMIFGDRYRLGQVITNLLTNAIKYSPDASVVDLSIERLDNQVIVHVRDYGIGIAKKHQDKVFDRFFRAAGSDEKTFPGLGIGLSVASEIVKRHGGNIWVESKKGVGSIFSFSLQLQS